MCSEAFPEGLLAEAVFHWAVASREGSAWSPPPDGWQSDPSRSATAGALPLLTSHTFWSVCVVNGVIRRSVSEGLSAPTGAHQACGLAQTLICVQSRFVMV